MSANKKFTYVISKIRSILTPITILCIIGVTPYCIVTVANINEKEYKDIDYSKYIISEAEFGFEFNLPKKNYREVSLIFDGLTENEVSILYSPYMQVDGATEGERIKINILCDDNQGLDVAFPLKSQRLEKNRTRIKEVLLGEWKKKNCKGVGIIYSELMSEELFSKARVVVDQGDMIFGLDIRENIKKRSKYPIDEITSKIETKNHIAAIHNNPHLIEKSL